MAQASSSKDTKEGKVSWMSLPSVTFLIPNTIDNNAAYLAGMFGLADTAELERLVQDEAVKVVLAEFHQQKDAKWGMGGTTALPVAFPRIFNMLSNPVYQAVLDAPLPLDPQQLNETTMTETVALVTVIVLCHQLICAAPAFFHSPSAALGRHAADDWAKALALFKFHTRSVQRAKGGTPAKFRKHPAAALQPNNAQASSVTAVTEETSEPTVEDIEWEDLDDQVPAEDFDDEEAVNVMETTIGIADRSTVEKGLRPLLTDAARTKVITDMMKKLVIVGVGNAASTELVDEEISRVALFEQDDGTMAVDDEGAFWAFQATLNASSNPNTPSYAEACEMLGVNPNEPILQIPQLNAPTLSLRLMPWQVIGVAWILRMDKVDLPALLADDCGLGKTLTTLTRIYLNLRLVEAGELRPPYRPVLIIAPAVLVPTWFDEIQNRFGNAIQVRVWHGTKSDSHSSAIKSAVLGHDAASLISWIQDLDPTDPATAVTVVLTAYQTLVMRGLCINNKPYASHLATRSHTRAARAATVASSPMDDLADTDGEVEETNEQGSDKTYSTTLTGHFSQVVCDEAHRIKNRQTLAHRIISLIQPQTYTFLTATPMANTASDILGFLHLVWKPHWADPNMDLDRPLSAFGLTFVQPNPRNNELTSSVTAVRDVTPSRAHLNPDLFKRLIRENNLEPQIAARVLPVILSVISLRRTFATEIELHDGTTERIGRAIPFYRISTVELDFKWEALASEYRKHHTLQVQRLRPGGGASADRGSHGHQNNAVHRSLCMTTLSLTLPRLLRNVGCCNVNKVNGWYAKNRDHGMSMLQKAVQPEPYLPVYDSRATLANFLAVFSPKLIWLADYVNHAHLLGERVLIFCEWPVCQWLVEGFLATLNFDVRSVRSALSNQQRVTAVADFNNLSKQVDALVCSYKTAAFGLNIQNACHRIVHVEVPGAMATLHQANGRVHRLGQTKQQEIYILTLDGSYDIFQQYRLARKYCPELAGHVTVPEGYVEWMDVPTATPNEVTEHYCGTLITTMLGQRASRLECDNLEEPYCFADHDFSEDPHPTIIRTPIRARRYGREGPPTQSSDTDSPRKRKSAPAPGLDDPLPDTSKRRKSTVAPPLSEEYVSELDRAQDETEMEPEIVPQEPEMEPEIVPQEPVQEKGAETDKGEGTVAEGEGTVEEAPTPVEKGPATVEKGDATVEKGDATVEKGDASVEKGDATVEKGDATVEKGTDDIGESTANTESPLAQGTPPAETTTAKPTTAKTGPAKPTTAKTGPDKSTTAKTGPDKSTSKGPPRKPKQQPPTNTKVLRSNTAANREGH